MRIIAGKYRSKILASFQGEEVRPTADRVKESVFQILSQKIISARVLDLFCGSGALGIECLSRGAREVVFNDVRGESLDLLRKNLSRVSEPREIYKLDYKLMLKRAEGKFDLIFSDPPYKENYLPEILSLVKERELLKRGGLVVHEGEREEEVPAGWKLCDLRKYGRTLVHFLEISE